jgi:tetratricopeptide (TPR) repeat protein
LYVNAFALDVSKRFLQANEAYEKADYANAAMFYENILKEVKNGNLYYNLGNCYFKEGKIGYALVNYLRAKKFTPNNNDLNDNINYLRTLTKDKIEDKSMFSFIYKIFSFNDSFSLKVYFYIFTLFNITFFSLLIIRLLVKKYFLDWLKNIMLFLLIFSAMGCMLNYMMYFHDKKGVIISGEVSVRSGSSLNDTTIFNLHEGTEFKAVDEKVDWLKIQLLDNKKGWVLKKVVELV